MRPSSLPAAPVQDRIRAQRAEDLRRLADQGAAKGVRILLTPAGAHVATSASNPTRAYVVSAGGGCECKGHAVWGRCQHHSLLLAELGLIDDPDPAPEPDPADAGCPECHGRGWTAPWPAPGGRAWLVSCRSCGGAAADRPAA